MSDQYIRSILAKYAVRIDAQSPALGAANFVAPTIRGWGSHWLSSIEVSGSYAKGTAVRGGADIDLFLSFHPTAAELAQLYQGVYQLAMANAWFPRKQDVSVGVTVLGQKIDLVPARLQQGHANYHSLYRSHTGTWTQTNVALHISTVQQSGRLEEIRAIKIWRNLRSIHFPSFYLELTVIDALRYSTRGALAANVWKALQFLASDFPSHRVVDPSNTNNIISQDLQTSEKFSIANQARQSVSQANWGSVLW